MTTSARIAILALVLISAACRRDEIEVYRIPKETPALPASMTTMPALPGMEAPAEIKKRIHWTTPAGWEEQPATVMRVASFLIKDSHGQADMSVIPLTGEVGGDLANVNRWRGQIGLPAWTADALTQETSIQRFKGHSMMWVDFANAGKRITAAIYKEGETSWFFKMMGDDATVKNAHPALKQFLNQTDFEGHAHE